MPDEQNNTLGEAITEAQRAQIIDARETAERRYRDQRWVHHDEIHALLDREHAASATAHEREHAALADSVRLALEAVERAASQHATAHQAAHDAHGREHHLEADARDKASRAVDQRLEGMNEVRSQLKDQALTFARVEVLNALTDRVIAIEKLDIKGEGRSLGQGAVVAVIVTAISVVGTLLGIVIVVSNLLTKAPA